MIETSYPGPVIGRPAVWKGNLRKQKESLPQRDFLIGRWQVGHMCSWLLSPSMQALFVSNCGKMSVAVSQEKYAMLRLMWKVLRHAIVCVCVCVYMSISVNR